MQLSIIIVNYNVKYFLEQCLCSVQKALQDIDAEVLVVDNCSEDGSIEYLLPKFPWVKFIAERTNRGFAKANNTALNHCKGDHVLYLNPDTILPENILQQCLIFFETNNNIGAIGVRMLDGAGNFLAESKRAFPSPVVSFYKLSGLSALFPKSAVFNKYALGNLSANEVHEVEVLCGAFMMAERKTLVELNGFDEAFFMYGEDIDLSYRIQQTGKKIFYLGTDCIVHFKGESSLRNNRKHLKIFYEAMFVFVNKHYHGVNAFLMKLFLQSGILLRSLLSLLALPFRKTVKSVRSAAGGPKTFLLLGDEESAAEAAHILSANNLKTVKLSSGLSAKSDTVVFCAGKEFSYGDAIAYIEDYKSRSIYFWHGSRSQSITGSADRNFTGLTYAV